MVHILLTTLNAKYIHTNLAIRLLYQLNRHYKGLEWKEYAIKLPVDEIAEACKHYDLVAFSCYIWNITQTLEVAAKLKKLNPAIKILLGGPEVSYEFNAVLLRPCIDYIIVGEGEIPFSLFLKNQLNPENIPGLAYKKNEEIVFFPESTIFDLCNYDHILPYQYDDMEALKHKILYIETSRGCPYKCEFCLASLDNKVRQLSMDSIKRNLLFLMEHGRVIKFLDRTFNVKKDFTIEIFKFILDHRKPGNIFQFEITADIVHPEIIEFINAQVPPGVFRFEIGIQTVNQKANLAVSRKQNFEKTKTVILQLQDKIEMHLDLIVGLPHDYWEDIKHSINEVMAIQPPELQLGFLKFLKGTPVRMKATEHGFAFDENPPYQLIESNFLSKNELLQLTQLEHALEIYWNKKRAINTLKYVCKNYDVFDFLLGLGKLFVSQLGNHGHQLGDIYKVLNDFVFAYNDNILHQLVAIDYYLNHKVRPGAAYGNFADKQNQERIINEQKLNVHRYRYIFLQLDFNFVIYKTENRTDTEGEIIILKFDGKGYPEVISTKAEAILPIASNN
ncbi:MAG: DUF4080 domain-containing protein [Bacteroidetes bacterium]|nr:DUF4080 domain-containing protein [Bacteroidota bacterium]